MTEIDTLVVGAGPQALTVLARWACDRPGAIGRVLVADPSGAWMRTWDRHFDRQRIDVLRSPGVHHPDPDEMAYLHAHRYRSRSIERAEAGDPLNGPLRRPETGAFARFCQTLIERTGLAERVVPGSVVDLCPTGESTIRWSATLCNGASVRARQVLWAGNPQVRRVPSGVELGDVIIHSSDVDLSTVRRGQRIAVLGGGQSAGQLALGAARAGAEAAIVSRGAQRISDLDVDAGWLMDDRLDPFRSIGEPVDRRRVVERERRGSMTADLVDALSWASVRWFDAAGEVSARPDGDRAIVGFAGAEIPVDRVWVATGSVPDLRADPVLARLALDGAPHVDGWPVLDEHLEWSRGVRVIGALAALTLGPAAGNLGGARAAAELLAPHAPAVREQDDGESPACGSAFRAAAR
ncbi:MAG: hypothetical protein AAGD18_24930 [Actinomycetota bacterium]